jgi:hypothetical protein
MTVEKILKIDRRGPRSHRLTRVLLERIDDRRFRVR